MTARTAFLHPMALMALAFAPAAAQSQDNPVCESDG